MRNLLLRIIAKGLKTVTPKDTAGRIWFGALKGMKWIYSSGYTRYWMGTYENEITPAFISYVKKSKVVYDLGAHLGYYTLLASKHIASGGSVYAFEPFPKNFAILKRHVEENGITNTEVFQSAISRTTGFTTFTNSDNDVANTICATSTMFQAGGDSIQVATVSLDKLLSEGKILPPQLIKMDVEGAEYDALLGAENMIKKYHPVFFLSTHNCQIPGIHKQCCDFLLSHGYTLTYFDFHKKETEMDDLWYELLAE